MAIVKISPPKTGGGRRGAAPGATAPAAAPGSAASVGVVEVAPDAVPYLIGIAGRNVSLIGRHTGTFVRVTGATAEITRREGAPVYDPELARRMVAGFCAGGVLKWFSTPAATAAHAPEPAVRALSAELAAAHDCLLRLLRARSGHMCLALVPLSDTGVAAVPAARAAALARLGGGASAAAA